MTSSSLAAMSSASIGSCTSIAIFVGSGSRGTMSLTARPHGGANRIGTLFRRASLSTISSLASHWPRSRKSAASWPPTLAIGTIGTPASRASFT